jgi:hypothetical protein
VNCQPCFDRTGKEEPAQHTVAGTNMCDACFSGRGAEPKPKTTEKNGRPARSRIHNALARLVGSKEGETRIRLEPREDSRKVQALIHRRARGLGVEVRTTHRAGWIWISTKEPASGQ